jgi:3-oxoacyl-[acyl-carrier-protein] synthase III
MREGVRTAQDAMAGFLDALGWTSGRIDKTFCHQVGRAHQKLLFESLGLDPAVDYTTLELLGNTGAVALPITAALGIENGHLARGDHVALLGIGSGINVIMLGVEWQESLLKTTGTGGPPRAAQAPRSAARSSL